MCSSPRRARRAPEFGDLGALRSKYPQAEAMGDDDKLKVLYGNLGEEP
jgi:hypothetical protein